ncbi:c-type cytochrome [Rhodopseudomonas palustris]|uniref:Cytochrome C n=1 Tax=Rhodopseudomonas palustris TaxID=1076 RepID=A0A418V3S1_RHOPL|nr:c-type cytochrome [Rhodopseudomonas palustris]RJF70739.1 cytochrome C [Rhodopseudomonas palustris]
MKDLGTWVVGVILLGLAGLIGYSLPRGADLVSSTQAMKPAAGSQDGGNNTATARPSPAQFVPTLENDLPTGEFGEMVKLGEAIFTDTKAHAGEFVGNDLRCANCHLDRGRLAHAAPMWAAYVIYPAYRSKDQHVNTFAERLQGCFRFSMNGKAPELGDKVLVALESYAFALAKGAPTGEKLPGQGFLKLPPPDALDAVNGQQVYTSRCATCHGADGQGQRSASGQTVFPPLWGPRSYNWGAGMSSITNAAGFIKANMPLSQGNTLSDREAWDVATYINSQERPQDPRFIGSVAETRRRYHNSPFEMYGRTVNGVTLGENSPLSGTVGR